MDTTTRNSGKLLVVENDAKLGQAVTTLAQQFNLETEMVSDGWDAIEKLEARDDYAAIVVDMDMPAKSGYGVLTFLRQERGRDLGNLILMTAGDTRRVRDSIREDRCYVVSRREAEIESALRVCTSRE